MRDAEIKRFQSGASDFFLVNLREQFEADARIRFLAGELERRIAEADYAAATVDLRAFGSKRRGARPTSEPRAAPSRPHTLCR